MKHSFLSLCVFLAVCGGAWAATDTWDGGGGAGNTNWNSGLNWQSGNPPATTGDLLIFDGAGGSANNNISNGSFTGIQFAATAGSFAFTGNKFTLTGGIQDDSASVQTIGVLSPIAIGNSIRAFSVSNAAGRLNISTVISGTSGGLNKTGGGTLALSGANTYGGATTVSAGTVIASNATALGAGATTVSSIGALNVYDTGVIGNINLTGGVAATTYFTLSGGGVLDMTLNSAGQSDSLTLSGGGLGTLAGTLVLDFTDSIAYGDTYTLFSGFTSLNTTGLSITGYDTSRYAASLSSSGLLTFNAVPEPSALLLMGGGAAFLLLVVRRRATA